MTVEEAQKWKRDAEDKILSIIRDLELQTGCDAICIHLTKEQTTAFIPLSLTIEIDLRVK